MHINTAVIVPVVALVAWTMIIRVCLTANAAVLLLS